MRHLGRLWTAGNQIDLDKLASLSSPWSLDRCYQLNPCLTDCMMLAIAVSRLAAPFVTKMQPPWHGGMVVWWHVNGDSLITDGFGKQYVEAARPASLTYRGTYGCIPLDTARHLPIISRHTPPFSSPSLVPFNHTLATSYVPRYSPLPTAVQPARRRPPLKSPLTPRSS